MMNADKQERAPRLDRLRMVIGEATAGAGGIIKDSLKNRGIRQVSSCRRTDQIFDALDSDIVDLLVCDHDLLGSDFITVMQGIRHKLRGRNPFVVIVAAVSDTHQATMRSLANAGVDHLVQKPVSAQRLLENMGAFSQKRKPFVVSHDYVGPERRLDHQTDLSIERMIQVPNTLRSRAIEGISDKELERVVSAAIASLDNGQVESFGLEIDQLSKQLVAMLDRRGSPQATETAIETTLSRIASLANHLGTNGLGAADRIAKIAPILSAMTQRVRNAGGERAKVEARLLEHLATAVRRLLLVEPNAMPVLQEIAQVVSDHSRKN